MVAEPPTYSKNLKVSCSLAKISMVAELFHTGLHGNVSCSLAKISMVAEHCQYQHI